MNNIHRAFIQYMLNNGSATVGQALSFCQRVQTASRGTSAEFTQPQLKKLISEINEEIKKQHFTITITTCEITFEEMVVWINTKNDDISKLQIAFSAIELEYFNVLMQELITSKPHKLTLAACLNMASTLTSFFTRDSGQKVLNKWLDGGYFVKRGENIYLGARTILEFTAHLRIQAVDCLCDLCSELVFVGKTCDSCDKTFHAVCLNKYFLKNQCCPSCKSQWQEMDQSEMETESQITRNQSQISQNDDSDTE